jgi:cholesterol oxidase
MTEIRHVDAVVVGSGFGGSVAAFRLAEGGREVILLERGRAYPPGSFARTPAELATAFWDPSEGQHGLFDLWSFAGLEGVVSAGLGGGSLIYANVLLRKDEKWFVTDAPVGDGYESWPISRAHLEPHYDAVERMLRPQRFPMGEPGYESSGKTAALKDAAGRLGLDWQLPQLAVTFATGGNQPVPGEAIPAPDYGNIHGRLRQTCRLCGECDIGCNYGAKNTLDHTYLSAAAHHGAEIRTRCEVRSFAPMPGGGWEVQYVEHLAENEGRPTKTSQLPVHVIRCNSLVLGAGTFGTTYLLLRNRAALPALSDRLGHRFSGNGDLLGFLLGARDSNGDPIPLGSSRAPVITSAIRVPDALDGGEGRGFYVEDAGYPGFADYFIETSDLSAQVRRGMRFILDTIEAKLARNRPSHLGGRVRRLLGDGHVSAGATALLGMGRDIPDGVMRIADDMLEIEWTTKTSKDYFNRVRDTMAALAEELGADFIENPLSHLDRVITVHPLGGASMGLTDATGVVDARGEAFGHPGLYVVDGAAMPGPVGANPSFTIAAFANCVADRILETPVRGVAAPAPRVALEESISLTDPPARTAEATSVEFTEEMKGFITLGETDPQTGFKAGRKSGSDLMFHLTIRTDDVDRFVEDRLHASTATGYVESSALGGRLPVTRGDFNLFIADTPNTRRMLYRLYFADAAGHPLTLSGFKVVRDDPGLDLWPDTSTLYTKLLVGHVSEADEANAEVTGAGILRIHLLDFAQQMTTFRASGSTAGSGGAGLAKFGRFFLGQLWDVYAPRHEISESVR